MFLLGTDCFLAFWMASKSGGLPDGSGPPIFAAISMFLISFANSLPRLASIAAFLCFVVAHLECPDMLFSLPQLPRTRSTNKPCTRESSPTSGWNDVAIKWP